MLGFGMYTVLRKGVSRARRKITTLPGKELCCMELTMTSWLITETLLVFSTRKKLQKQIDRCCKNVSPFLSDASLLGSISGTFCSQSLFPVLEKAFV